MEIKILWTDDEKSGYEDFDNIEDAMDYLSELEDNLDEINRVNQVNQINQANQLDKDLCCDVDHLLQRNRLSISKLDTNLYEILNLLKENGYSCTYEGKYGYTYEKESNIFYPGDLVKLNENNPFSECTFVVKDFITEFGSNKYTLTDKETGTQIIKDILPKQISLVKRV